MRQHHTTSQQGRRCTAHSAQDPQWSSKFLLGIRQAHRSLPHRNYRRGRCCIARRQAAPGTYQPRLRTARIKIAMAERRHRSRYEYRARCCLDSHGWQRLVRVASENEPGLHGVWTVAPAPQKLPFGQSSHCSAACKPVSDEYVPATQTSSADEPFGQNRPGPQMEHAVAPDPVW